MRTWPFGYWRLATSQSHRTIRDFCALYLEELSELFTQVVRLAREMGLVLRPDLIPTQGPKLFEVEYGGASHSNSGGAHTCK